MERELQAFHSEDYVQFLQRITPSNKARLQPLHEPKAGRKALDRAGTVARITDCCPVQEDYLEQLENFHVGEDCPVFTGLYRYCQARAPPSPLCFFVARAGDWLIPMLLLTS